MALNEELLIKLSNIPQIPQWVQDEIDKYGTPTGSWRFGGKAKVGADRDIIISPYSKLTADGLISDNLAAYAPDRYGIDFVYSVYTNGTDGRVYNLLIFHRDKKDYYDAYVYATKEVVTLFRATKPKTEARAIFENKAKRIAMFECFVQLFING